MKSAMLMPIALGLGLVAIMFGIFEPLKEPLPMSYTYNSENCTVSVNGHHYETGIAKKINGEWVIIEREIETIDCSLITNSTGTFITIHKVFNEGTLGNTFSILKNSEWRSYSQFKFTNNGEKDEFAFTESIKNIPSQPNGMAM